MSVLVTNKALKECYRDCFVWLHDRTPFLTYENPVYYTRGLYGVNFQGYIVPNERWQGTLILCGDRTGNIPVMSNYELEKEYADGLKDMFAKHPEYTDEDKKQYTRTQLVNFISHLLTIERNK